MSSTTTMKDLLNSIDRTSSSSKSSREQELIEKLRQLKKLPLKDIQTHKKKEKEISVLVDTLNSKTKKMLLLLEKWDGARIKKAAKNLNHFSEWASQIETDLHKVDRLLKKMPSD
eukprot:g3185.t1